MTEPRWQALQRAGDALVEVFRFMALIVIGGTVAWSAVHEYLGMMQQGYAALRDILLLFIYLEIGAMTGIYFRTRQLPVQFLIYIAITALSRHLVLDSKAALEAHHEMVLLVVSGCILLLAVAVLVLGETLKYSAFPVRGRDAPARTRAQALDSRRPLRTCAATGRAEKIQGRIFSASSWHRHPARQPA